jgi:hypothetical protein
MKCIKNGIKRYGESCTLNDNCIYPDCMEKSIIRDLNLTKKQVHKIVLEWYTNGMCPDIWQDADGNDLEEYLEPLVYD